MPAARLLDAVLLLEHADEVVHLLRRVEVLGHGVDLAAPPRPRRQLGARLLDAEPAVPLVAVEPRRERDERDVDEAEPAAAAAEEVPVAELRLQRAEDLHHLGARLRLRLPLELPQPGPAVVELLVDVVRPEPRPGPRVRRGREELRGVGEGLVEVGEDDERLADGAAGVEEDGDLLVDGVGAEEEVALVGEVLLAVLEVEALLGHGDPAPLPERAHPEVEQHQVRLLLRRHG
uniref:Uncharacterized protein n=1 Tax=Oryza brachyantha TaxID=4533 RepID=J3LTH2_ORYBR